MLQHSGGKPMRSTKVLKGRRKHCNWLKIKEFLLIMKFLHLKTGILNLINMIVLH
jgi:hypothetical protein